MSEGDSNNQIKLKNEVDHYKQLYLKKIDDQVKLNERNVKLEGELKSLKNQLKKKDKRISGLQAELEEKKRDINKLKDSDAISNILNKELNDSRGRLEEQTKLKKENLSLKNSCDSLVIENKHLIDRCKHFEKQFYETSGVCKRQLEIIRTAKETCIMLEHKKELLSKELAVCMNDNVALQEHIKLVQEDVRILQKGIKVFETEPECLEQHIKDRIIYLEAELDRQREENRSLREVKDQLMQDVKAMVGVIGTQFGIDEFNNATVVLETKK